MESIFNRYPCIQTLIDLFFISRVAFKTYWRKILSIVSTVFFHSLIHIHQRDHHRKSKQPHIHSHIPSFTRFPHSHNRLKFKYYTHNPIPVAIARKRHSRTNQNKPTLREIEEDPLVNWKSIFFNKKTEKTLRINLIRDTEADDNVNSFDYEGLSVIV